MLRDSTYICGRQKRGNCRLALPGTGGQVGGCSEVCEGEKVWEPEGAAAGGGCKIL